MIKSVRYSYLLCLLSLIVIATPADSSGEDVCTEVRFENGTEILVRRDKLKWINAVMEWPWGKRIFSVSIVLPPPGTVKTNNTFENIVIAPIGLYLAKRKEAGSESGAVCFEVSDGGTRCDLAVNQELSVGVGFKGDDTGSLQSTMNSIADYVSQHALNCSES